MYLPEKVYTDVHSGFICNSPQTKNKLNARQEVNGQTSCDRSIKWTIAQQYKGTHYDTHHSINESQNDHAAKKKPDSKK